MCASSWRAHGVKKESVTLALTPEQVRRIRTLGGELSPEEDPGLFEMCRRLLLEAADRKAAERGGRRQQTLEEACWPVGKAG